MKKSSAVLSFMFLFVFVSFVVSAEDAPQKKMKEWPADVKAVIEKSCYGCHNSDSKNEDAKEELNFDKIESLSKIKKIGAYKHIGETVKEGEMPPKKFLQKYPEKALSEAEKKILMAWAKKEAETLVKK